MILSKKEDCSSVKKEVISPSQYVSYPMRHAPLGACLMLVFRILNAVLPTVQIAVLAGFINEALTALGGGALTSVLLIQAGKFIVLVIADRLLDILTTIVSTYFKIHVNSEYELFLLGKRSRVAYQTLEQEEACDLISRVTEDQSGQMYAGFENLMNLAEFVIRIAGIVITAMVSSVWAGLLMMAMFVLVIPLAKRCGEENYEAYERAAGEFRRAKYLRGLLSGREYAAERTLFGYTKVLNQRWEAAYGKGTAAMREADKKNTVRIKAASVSIVLITMVLAMTLLWPVRAGSVTAGLYISILTATIQLLSVVTWNLVYYLEDYAKNKCYLTDLQQFLQLPEISPETVPEQAGEPAWTQVEEIEFDHVSFRYPGSERLILDQISFRLTKGNTYGFVGENGAGKTTIVKLLLGLYREYEGVIRVNGTDLRTIGEACRRRLFAAVYQDYARYQISVWDNLTLGCAEEPSKAEVTQVLEDLQLMERTASLPDGLQTEVGQLEEASLDFSGGEWQKIAIARAMLRHAPVLILDEPTASLDPIHERDLYQLFDSTRRGDIRLLITHRLGGVKTADCILVLGQGRVLEQGTHEALLAQNGVYAEMYESQRRWYQ